MVLVESAGITDIGKKRKGNEDALFLDDEIRVYVVADGMGGHSAGEVASDLVVKTIKDYMRRFRENKDVEELAVADESLSKEANRLVSSIHLSNRVVYQLAKNKPVYRGMGSTVSAVYFTEDTIIAANVGDSPIYLIRNNSIEPLYQPHTVLASQPDGGKRLGNPLRHMLTQAMGVEREVVPYVCELQYFKDDMLIIASDGLSDKVSPDEVIAVTNDRLPEEICKILVDMANERGGDDNITIIALKLKPIEQKRGITGWLSRFFNNWNSQFKKGVS